MNWQFTPAVWLYVLAAGACFGIAWRSWSLRNVRGALLFCGMTLSAGVWTLGYLFGFFHRDLSVKLAMLRIEYLGAIGTVVLWLLFAAAYGRADRWVRRRTFALLALIPILTYLQILTVEHHDFFYRSYTEGMHGDLVVSLKDYGPGFYLWLAYSYSMVIAGTIFLIRGLLYLPPHMRQQVIPVTASAVVVLLPNIFYVTGLNPVDPYDPTCVSFCVCGLLLFVAMGRYHFLDLVPVAHDLVIKHARIGVVVVDEMRRILEINPMARELLGVEMTEAMGRPLEEIMHCDEQMFERSPEHRIELSLGSDRIAEIQSTPIFTRQGIHDGRIVMLYDISDRKRVEEELRRQATTDPLTEVYNRRQFFVLAEQYRRQAQRNPRPVSVALIDLDHFKGVNDRFGHAVGDEVLREVAGLLKSGLRQGDILVRYGGEEFVLLMPETDLEQAAEVAERVRRLFEQSELSAPSRDLRISISAGVSELDPQEDRAVERLVDRADQALYAAKEAGRNRIEVCALAGMVDPGS